MKMFSMRIVIPSMFTLGNLLCGFLAVANVVEGTREALISAAWWIIIATVFDALDGKVARLTGSASKFGIEFDSIADVVSFGIAPAILFYRFAFADAGKVCLFLSFIFLAAGAIRLARFNVSASTGSKKYFTGMPIPVGAGILASYVLFCNVWEGLSGFNFAVALVILTSLAMVSQFKYNVLPKLGFRRTKDIFWSIFFLGMLILIACFPDEVLFPFGIVYLFSGPMRYFSAPALIHVFHKADNNRF
ncbi:MAG: CDP-diacylglycerol--serine O-phosphatidyltransferase [Candidatus Latescibacter sp.]|nr:CDP-diacylglycerol--serine O-phosphatidyltransferase [Candidatus Latescibacter sp.]